MSVCLSKQQQWPYLGKMALFLHNGQHVFVFQCYHLILDFRLSVYNTIPSQYHLTTGSTDKTAYLSAMSTKKIQEVPLILEFSWENKRVSKYEG